MIRINIATRIASCARDKRFLAAASASSLSLLSPPRLPLRCQKQGERLARRYLSRSPSALLRRTTLGAMPSTAGERAGREGRTEEMRWCIAEDAAFEDALATISYPLNEDASGGASEDEDRWLEALASRVPGKTAAQVKMHYEILVADVEAIEDGMVPTPPHWDDQLSSSPRTGGSEAGGQVNRVSVPEQDRRKGMPWTEQEHRAAIIVKIMANRDPSVLVPSTGNFFGPPIGPKG
ncbi:Transcription factor DIVARICATA [Platanthera guangdongensis]|uniref:Transcription factor DIVARICATA n=1 Tax=Platanthera guangdongensis TaxID=2320717 RepID=A0ABR2M3D5_9ASPA